MRPRKLVALCALCALWAAGGAEVRARPRASEKAFAPSMSLEETMAWLGGQLKQTRTEVSDNGQRRRPVEDAVRPSEAVFAQLLEHERRRRPYGADVDEPDAGVVDG